MILRVCDFFSGFHSWTEPLKDHKISRKVFSVDNNPDYAHNTTIIDDFLQITPGQIRAHFGGKNPHVVLASPPCTTFSIASCSHHWYAPDPITGERKPKSEAAVIGLKLLKHLLYLIEELDCLFFFENPRGLMRKMDCLEDVDRQTIWYCQYGRSNGMLRAKPTDIWTNSKIWQGRPVCKNGNPDCDHERAPRGAKTGTQGLKNNAERSLIPFELCEEIMLAYLKELGY
jgi:site-specific DNA-cytosine methylase